MKSRTILFVLLAILSAATISYADEAAESRAKVQALYPGMIQALNANDLDQARDLCLKIMALEPLGALHRYNLACIEARAGNTDAAIASLNQALELGFASPDKLQNDPDLASIRRHPLFGDLTEKAARNAQQNPNGPGSVPGDNVPNNSVPNDNTGGNDGVAKPEYTANGPVGPFFMIRYWSATRVLEKAVWYFAPGGRVYTDLKDGFTAADLAAHRGPRGIYRLDGDKMTIRWNDGKSEDSPVERDQASPTTFMWQMGTFNPIAPFANAQAVAGRYDGGEMVGGGDRTQVGTAQSINLNADGTFTQTGVGMIRGNTDQVEFGGGGVSSSSGTWQLSGFSLVLTPSNGKVTRRLAFPFDDPDTAANPDRVFIGWLLFKKN